MSTTFSLYKPLTPPQSITHATHAQFLAPGSLDLIVVKNNYLEIYSLPSQSVFDQPASNATTNALGGLSDQTLLQRKLDTKLFGNVEGISSVRLSGWSRDVLLLIYPHSKLSLCAWDTGLQEIVTLGIWAQDEEVVEKERERLTQAAALSKGQLPPQPPKVTSLIAQVKKYIPPMLRVDPQNRCAALVTFDAFLHIFDFAAAASVKHESGEAAAAVQSGINVSSTGATSFYAHAPSTFSSMEGVGHVPSLAAHTTYSLSALGLGTINDMQFLFGFEDPTLLILHEKRRTWEGRYAAARLTQELSCVTFHLRNQGFSLIGSVTGVAHDAFAIHPIPMPLGGALIVQQNLLVHWNNNALDYALAVNDHGVLAARTDKMPHADQSAHVMKLDQSRLTFLHVFSDRAFGLVTTEEGVAFLLTIHPSGTLVRSMTLEPVGQVPRAQGLIRMRNPQQDKACMLGQGMGNQHNIHAMNLSAFIFLYSRLGPSLLIEFRKTTEQDYLLQRQEEEQENLQEQAEQKAKILAEQQAQKELAERQAQEAAAAAANANANGSSTAMDTSDLKAPIPSLAARLDAAGTSDAASSKPASDSAQTDQSDERPAKRSKLDELYTEMTTSDATGGMSLEADELMDVFGFGRKGEQAKEEQEQLEAQKANQPVTQADPNKEAEVLVAQQALEREEKRVAMLEKAMRSGRKELSFFVRDRLLCTAPASDLVLSYAAPKNPAEDKDDALQQHKEDELSRRAEVQPLKPNATDEETRAQQDKEQQAMFELEKYWREKERRSRVLEFIQLTGHAESGAIALGTEGLMPEIITASPLQRKCVGCWTVRQGSSAATQGKKKRRTTQQQQEEEFHSLLLISTPVSTLIIQTGEELSELPEGQHAFYTGRTLLAANIQTAVGVGGEDGGGGAPAAEAIVQVYRQGFRLIQNGAVTQDYPVEESLAVDSAHVEGGYLVLRMSDLSLQIFQTQQSSLTLVNRMPAQIDAACLFADSSAERVLKRAAGGSQTESTSSASPSAVADGTSSMEVDLDSMLGGGASKAGPAAAAADPMELDDLDRLLAGETATPIPIAQPQKSEKEKKKAAAAAPIVPADIYLIVAEGNQVRFHLLPTLTLVYSIDRFAAGKRILRDARSGSANNVGAGEPDSSVPDSALPAIQDLCVDTLGSNGLPTLFSTLANGDTFVYESFLSGSALRELRWQRSAQAIFTRPFLNSKVAASSSIYRDAFGPRGVLARPASQPFVSRWKKLPSLFGSGQEGHRGVMLLGSKPYLFLSLRGQVRGHPFIFDSRPRTDDSTTTGTQELEDEEDLERGSGSANESELASIGQTQQEQEDEWLSEEITATQARKKLLTAVTPLHNPSCPFGLVFFDAQGTLHMSVLPPPTKTPHHPLYMSKRKLARLGLISSMVASLNSSPALSPSIGASPVSVEYDSPLLTRMVHLGATPVFLARHTPTDTIAVVLAHKTRVPSLELETEKSLPQYELKYSVVIFSSTFEVQARYSEFEPHEMVLCMSPIRMNGKMYLCLGTSEYLSEDSNARGRIILIDLFHTTSNSGLIDPLTGQQQQVKLLKMKVYSQAEKLPVSNVTQFGSNILVTAQASRIILYKHTGRQLAGCAFFDGQLYITSISCLNNFILYGDVQRGLHLLYYDPILRTLTHLGMSNEQFHVNSCDFLIDMKNLNLVSADEQKNLQIFRFTPNTPSNAANKIHSASYENMHAQNPNTQTLKESPYTGTSLLGGLGYKMNLKNDFHLGERVGRMLKLKLRTRAGGGPGAGTAGSLATPSLARLDSQVGVGSPHKLARQLSAASASANARPIQSYLLMASFEGSYSQLLPIDQLVFRRLNTLVVQMTTTLKQVGGLNPLAYRLFQTTGVHHPHFAKKLLDTTLLFQYPLLDIDYQWQLANQIGTTPSQIIENIKWIVWATQCH